MRFLRQFVIMGDSKVFNFLRQGQLQSLIFKFYNFIGFPLSCVKDTTSIYLGFIDSPLVLHQTSIFLRLRVSSVTVLRCCCRHHSRIIRISLCWVSLNIQYRCMYVRVHPKMISGAFSFFFLLKKVNIPTFTH